MMYSRSLKLLSLFTIMWFASLITIVRKYKVRNNIVSTKQGKYDVILKSFEGNISDYSPFKIWRMLPNANYTVSQDEKIRIIKGSEYPPGMDGRPVKLIDDIRYSIRQEIQKGWREHGFNQFVSDLIPTNRSLLDPRDQSCKKQNYSCNLPNATVIICFYNEAWSTLIRTVESVINRTPDKYLDQIILVDDFSTMDHLKYNLEEYINKTIKAVKVKLLRTARRKGIAKARVLPLNQVSSPVIVYLDSHIECPEGWLEPLLQRIENNPTTVASPVIDSIHGDTFEYISQDINDLHIGGFNWDLKFTWLSVPNEYYKNRKYKGEPIKTPTIAGGIFAINKQFFEKLGYYDDFEIWGAENLELSFKTWMCGGVLEIVPCSHVGHIFRAVNPYDIPLEIKQRNFGRLAKVWLDEYNKYYFERVGGDKKNYGNFTSRIELRKKLNCKSFKWYLDTIYPQCPLPENYVASGSIYSGSNNGLCIDANLHTSISEQVQLQPCHFSGGSQYWIITSRGEIRRDNICLDFMLNKIGVFFCRNSPSQMWLYDIKTQLLKHVGTELCLNIAKFPEGLHLVLSDCIGSSTQRWVIEHYKLENLAPQMQMALREWQKWNRVSTV